MIGSARDKFLAHNAYAFYLALPSYSDSAMFLLCHRCCRFLISSLLCRMSIKQKSIAICAYRSIQIVNDFSENYQCTRLLCSIETFLHRTQSHPFVFFSLHLRRRFFFCSFKFSVPLAKRTRAMCTITDSNISHALTILLPAITETDSSSMISKLHFSSPWTLIRKIWCCLWRTSPSFVFYQYFIFNCLGVKWFFHYLQTKNIKIFLFQSKIDFTVASVSLCTYFVYLLML